MVFFLSSGRQGWITNEKESLKYKERKGLCPQGCSDKLSHGGSEEGSLLDWQN